MEYSQSTTEGKEMHKRYILKSSPIGWKPSSNWQRASKQLTDKVAGEYTIAEHLTATEPDVSFRS